jgi:ribosome-interacting GTPase 1
LGAQYESPLQIPRDLSSTNKVGLRPIPTNLSPQCLAARRKYMEAETPNEKISSLREYISLVPRHKGTERLLRQLRSKLSKLEGEAERHRSLRKGSGGSSAFHIKKEGAGQIVLVGLTTSGRSSILRWLTNAKPEISPHSFKTRIPVPGMMSFEDVLIQLVEVPALYADMGSGKGLGPQIIGAIRNSDAIALTVDLSRDTLQQMETTLGELDKASIRPNEQPPRIGVEKTGSGGVQVFGISFYKDDIGELKDILSKYSHNVKVQLYQPTTKNEILEVINPKMTYRKAIIIGTKGDTSGSSDQYKILQEKYGSRFPVVAVSADMDRGKEQVKRELFNVLQVIRVYTKEPREKPSEKPIVLRRDATISDLTKKMPKVFSEQFKYAKVMGPSAKFEMEYVGANHALQDKDVVQLYLT